jgi:nicotinate-nucleotide pyrophosphorylase
LRTVHAVAFGVNVVLTGMLTHSVQSVDVGLEIRNG